MTQPPPNTALPPALAVAGGWGHIGGGFARAALGAGVRVFVHDPAPRPGDGTLADAEEVRDAAAFYALPVPFYHLALQPAHRDAALGRNSLRVSAVAKNATLPKNCVLP